jgi:hypothetical protein
MATQMSINTNEWGSHSPMVAFHEIEHFDDEK